MDDESPRTRRRLRWRWVVPAVVLFAVLGTAGGWLWIRHEFDPIDPPFGIPRTIPLCSRTFWHSDQDTRLWTLAEARAFEQTANGGTPVEPIVLEPTIGDLPIFRPTYPWRPPAATCEMGIWLHVGPDAYVAYTLEGGP
jgi:hypothetical protein